MMGVPNRDPNTPPLEMVKVPPSMSSIARVPLRACTKGGNNTEYPRQKGIVYTQEVKGQTESYTFSFEQETPLGKPK